MINLNKEQNKEEISLIADYEMEWGEPEHWPEYIVKEFNDKWTAIGKKYR